MPKLLHNPEKGSEIKNFVFKNEHYMDAKEGQAFAPGMVVNIESDELAEFMLSTWGFLEEISYDKAKKYLESKEEFPCDKCEFKTKYRIAFEGHKKKHFSEAQVDELGIPKITKSQVEKEIDDKELSNKRLKAWDAQDNQAGLIGEGLTEDHV